MNRVILFLAVVVLTGCSQEGKVARHLAKGNEHYEAGEYELATIEYLNVLQKDRSNGVAMVRSGLAHYELGNIREAGGFLQEGVKLEPDNLELRQKLGSIYRLAGMIPTARAEALAILERDPDHFDGLMLLIDTSLTQEDLLDVEARLTERDSMYGDRPLYHMAMAQIHLRKREPAEAGASLNRALELSPEDVRVLEALADYHGSLGDGQKSEDYLAQASELAETVSTTRVKWLALQYAKGNQEESLQGLREMVAENPEFAPAWIQLGNYALVGRRTNEVEQAVEAILNVNPEHYTGRLLQARLLLVQGESERAIEVLQSLLRQNSTSGALHHQLGLAYLRDGKIEQARNELREAVTLDRRLVQAALQLAELNLRTGQASTAARDMAALIGERGEFPEAVLILARAHLADNEPQLALDSLRGLEELQPDSHVAPFLRGEILLRQDRNREAREAFELALERSPDNASVTARLAILDLREDKPEQAIARVEEAIEKVPEKVGLRNMLGIIYAQTGESELAEQAFRDEIALNPTGMEAYMSLTKLLVQQDRVDEALAQVEEGLARQPDDIQTLLLSGMFLEEKGDYDQAIERYTRILELEPGFSQAMNNAAYLYVEKLGDLDKAFALAKQARELSPKNAAIADTLGWIAYQRGEYPWALNLIKEAAETHAENPEVQYHLGLAQLAMGNETEALDMLTQATEAEENVLENVESVRAIAALLAVPVDQVTPAQQALIDAALAADARNPAALVRQAILLEPDDPVAAHSAYQAIMDSHPQYLPATLRRIDLLDQVLQDRTAALEVAREARTARPDDPALNRRVGWLALRAGETAWAHNLIQESARALPGNRSVAYNLAVATYYLGETSQSEQMLAELVDSTSANDFAERPAAVQFLGLVRSAESPAQALVDQASAVDADNPASVPAAMVIARSQELNADAAAAVATLEAVLERVPTFAPAAAGAARLYADVLGDSDTAYPLANRAREALPDDAGLARLLGRLTYEREDYGYAIRLLEQGLRAAPDHADSLYLLGLSRQQQGDAAGARTALEKALELDPDSPRAALANQVLTESN